VGSVVLSGETNEETGPKTEHDATVNLPLRSLVFSVSENNGERFRKHGEGGDKQSGHQNGGDDELKLELGLNGTGFNVGEEGSEERGTNTNSGNNHGEVNSILGKHELERGAGNDKSGAGGLSEGTEKISTHTSNITNVVTDVISNGTGVERRVLRKLLTNLTSKISTNISSLGVDTTTDSSEKGDGGATETVSRNEFEKFSNEVSPHA
jgi:hypothetical protein